MTTPDAIGADVPICLCKQVMHRQPARPVFRYSAKRNEYLIWCPTCGYRTHPDENKQAVITEWYLANQPCDKHIEKIWLRRYREIHESGAMAPPEET